MVNCKLIFYLIQIHPTLNPNTNCVSLTWMRLIALGETGDINIACDDHHKKQSSYLQCFAYHLPYKQH